MCLSESYSKDLIGKHLSDTFAAQNGLKQGDDLCIAFQFCLRIRHYEGQENQVGIK
jgi:hypothetical protein